MPAGHFLNDGQSQAGSGERTGDPMERGEPRFPVLARDAGAGILYGNDPGLALPAKRHLNQGARGRVFDGVAEQLYPSLPHARGVNEGDGAVREIHVNRQPPPFGGGQRCVDRLHDNRPQIAGRPIERRLALDRQVQQARGEGPQPVDLVADFFQRVAQLGRFPPAPAGAESMPVLMMVSGVRSSWAASAINRSWLARASRSRVVASASMSRRAAISSPVGSGGSSSPSLPSRTAVTCRPRVASRPVNVRACQP